MTVIRNASGKTCILSARHIKSMLYFFFFLSFQIQDARNFFLRFVSVMHHYHINGLHLFWNGFELFYLQINLDAKCFPLLSKALWLRVNSRNSILISNLKPKNHNIIISIVFLFLAVSWVQCILRHPIYSFFSLFFNIYIHLVPWLASHIVLWRGAALVKNQRISRPFFFFFFFFFLA